ncbi:hypothetical protein Goshw_002092 [Gossypium schwendimanii]|uniref:DUF7745 domain-containing protein n=1 Tax=Gossypium schwendimanii TaxID=34291 RepID=A0A7J9L0D2_GOSSC|nr:hypothetical protein [Gossypium schwendimanii]
MNITGMSEQWITARIKQKGDCRCIPWKNLRDLILVYPDMKKRADVFALRIYGLVVFPKALGYVDEIIFDLFDQLDKRVTPVPVILAETFRALNACRKVGEGRFIGCAQHLLAWFHSHFWKVGKVSYRVFSEDYSLLKELVATLRALWMIPNEILYRCGNFNWVPLLGFKELSEDLRNVQRLEPEPSGEKIGRRTNDDPQIQRVVE